MAIKSDAQCKGPSSYIKPSAHTSEYLASGEYQAGKSDVVIAPTALSQAVTQNEVIAKAPIYVTVDGKVSKTPTKEKIDKIDIYVMFLFETENFVSDEQLEVQASLRRAFEDFRRKIGMSALAVTLIERKIGLTGDELDIDRNRKYQKLFGLDTKKAPHIVILDKHPDEWKDGDKMVCLSLNRIPIEGIHHVGGGS